MPKPMTAEEFKANCLTLEPDLYNRILEALEQREALLAAAHAERAEVRVAREARQA